MTYGYPPAPQPPPAPRPRSGIDIGVSITALILTFAGGVVGAFMAFFMMAFTDYCPPETCNIDAGVTALFTGFGIAALIAITGTVVTIVALVRRAKGWPWAAGTMVACAAACVLGIAGYLAAVGG